MNQPMLTLSLGDVVRGLLFIAAVAFTAVLASGRFDQTHTFDGRDGLRGSTVDLNG